MSNCSYLVTAQHATSVSHCDTGNFTSATDLNLLIARGNRIEIMLVTPEGLRYKIYESILVAIDPEARVIGLRLYDSLFKVIPLDRGQMELKAFNIRIEEINIHAIQFLHGCQHPTLALLHQDVHGRHVKSHELSLKDTEFVKVAWKQDNVERRADMLIAVPEPFGGVLIIGAESITFHSGTNSHTIAPPAIQSSSIVAYSMVDGNGSRFLLGSMADHLSMHGSNLIMLMGMGVGSYWEVDGDGSRFLLGNMAGHLFMLLLEKEEKMERSTQVNMKLELLGETSIPETISYLDNGYVYIGSRLGDSQLIKLNAEPDINGSFVTIVDIFTNLGPIIDMIVVDLEKQGQGQLVTCSGGFKDGSLRIIRNGIGIHELATIDLPGIKGMWPLRVGSNMDNTLILTFVEQTTVLSLVGEDVEETDIPGFSSDQQTFFAGNTDFDQILQITPGGVRLVSSQSKDLVDLWNPPGGKQISVCGTNGSQVLVACGSVLFYLEVQSNKLALRGDCTLEFEVACIDLTPIEEGETRAEIASIGLWTDISVRLLRIPSLEEITREMIGGEIIPRSILIAKFEGVNYLLCSLGDGSLIYYLFTPQGTLVDRRKVTLGTQPTVLRKFRTQSTTNVFVCSDRPTVIYSSNKKLVFANVNLKEVKHMCSLNTDAYPECLALTSDTSITIGTIDEIQKLHIRSVPLGEAPMRIAYQEETSTFGVLTKRLDIMDKGGLKHSRESVTTQAVSTSVAVTVTGLNRSGESYLLFSIESCKLGADPTVYYVVGTAIVNPDESEPKMGRLVIFSWADNKLTQVAEKETKGAVWTAISFNKTLMTTINNTVRLWDWTCDKELRLECSNFNHIMALFAKVSGDFILIGDLLKSMILLQHKPMEGSLDEIAKDYSPNWMTAVEIIDDEKFLGAEMSANLFVCQRDSGANTEEERLQMSEVGNIHLGDSVNVIRKGSLVMENLGDSAVPYTGSMLVGTVLGSIKLITQIPQDMFDLLEELQSRLTKKIKSVGRIQHSFYREFYNEKKQEHSVGFIDGDVIESFLDLDRSIMDDICNGLTRKNGTERSSLATEEVMKIVEDLTRMH
ncbi:DNA damage-binding protein 1 [Eurytemora carolleeae]|uniref:DNA damage-binding protein 1 n=1 Tax=Eurytemora carolleeae TaxID=1294199 RepID=UPI000C75F6A6|nr:DNA damage-binding protein 1 [Eurytemora carolleeae]|eukprot:XP_023326230.1 DNA damage-binding protein 1-like [Eurytemora affinis]